MPAALIYVQHLLGIGHLMRARSLAEALAAGGYEVLLVSGGMPAGGRGPRNVHLLQLPPIRAADATLKPLVDAEGRSIDDAYKTQRRDLLLGAYDSLAPAVVLTEAYPFGRRALRFELEPLMQRIEASRPRPVLIASVRDILQVRRQIEREHEMLEAANRWFDAILVHGDPRFARFDATFPLAACLRPHVHYTGFVSTANGLSRALVSGPRHEVVVSAGGGAVGMDLLVTALAAKRQTRFDHLPWRFLVGTNATDADFRRLQSDAGQGVIVERARPDFPALLRSALVSISQAGYNTMLEVCASGARAVFVPFARNGETEQGARAKRLAELELGIVVEDRHLTPATLAAAVDAAGSRSQWGRWDFGTDGAARSAMLVAMLAGVHARHAETAP